MFPIVLEGSPSALIFPRPASFTCPPPLPMIPVHIRWKHHLSRPSLLPLAIFTFALACRLVDFSATSITGDEVIMKDSGPWWGLIKAGNFVSDDWGYGKPALAIMRLIYGVIPQALLGEIPGSPHDMVLSLIHI